MDAVYRAHPLGNPGLRSRAGHGAEGRVAAGRVFFRAGGAVPADLDRRGAVSGVLLPVSPASTHGRSVFWRAAHRAGRIDPRQPLYRAQRVSFFSQPLCVVIEMDPWTLIKRP